jgi:hypothetical protein
MRVTYLYTLIYCYYYYYYYFPFVYLCLHGLFPFYAVIFTEFRFLDYIDHGHTVTASPKFLFLIIDAGNTVWAHSLPYLQPS